MPQYFISKNKIDLQPGWNVTAAINGLIDKYSEEEINTSDGLKIDFAEGWVQLRQSNTEPIIRVYSESYDEATANRLAEKIIGEFKELIG